MLNVSDQWAVSGDQGWRLRIEDWGSGIEDRKWSFARDYLVPCAHPYFLVADRLAPVHLLQSELDASTNRPEPRLRQV